MLGRFLKKLDWHRKPVTHATALWALVGFALIVFMIFAAYVHDLTSVREGTVLAKPLSTRLQQKLPSVFGKVTGREGAVITVESKQTYTRILVDEVTDVTRIGGRPFDLSDLEAGATVMATGHEAGDDTIVADAIVIIEEEDLQE